MAGSGGVQGIGGAALMPLSPTLREIGVALGVAVLTAVFTGAGGQLTPTGYVSAAIPAVLVGASVPAGSALIALALPAGRSSRRAAP
ncbi:MAG: hypothetical protein ACYCZY_10790 [Lacisediminihabitans sp.]